MFSDSTLKKIGCFVEAQQINEKRAQEEAMQVQEDDVQEDGASEQEENE